MRDRMRFMYPKIGKGRAAIAVERGELYYSPTARVGYAFCSPKDQFVRAKGRLMAKGRLTARGELGSYFEISFPFGTDSKAMRETIVGLVEACAPRWGSQ